MTTQGDEVADYLNHLAKERDVSPNTVRAYTRDLHDFIEFLGRNRELAMGLFQAEVSLARFRRRIDLRPAGDVADPQQWRMRHGGDRQPEQQNGDDGEQFRQSQFPDGAGR